MKKRFLAMFLALVMCLALLPTAALAADGDFTIENGVLKKYNGPGGAVTIPDGVTSIRWGAFENCTGLTSVTIPDSVTIISEGAFSICTSLTAIQVSAGNQEYAAVDGVLFSKDLKTLVAYPVGRKGAYTIPNSVTSIEWNAFENCTGLTNVTIPNGVTDIRLYAFENCTGLTSVTIPDSVTSIGDWAFYGCTGLTAIQVSAGNQEYAAVDGVLFSKDLKILLDYPDGRKGAYTIPDSVTGIGHDAFSVCTGLTSVTIPDSVTSIGPGAFYGCTGLTSVTFGSGLRTIGYYSTSYGLNMTGAFAGCTGLTNVAIPDGVTCIGVEAFSDCTGLSSVAIPASVTTIDDDAFRSCNNLENIYYSGAAEQWAGIIITSWKNQEAMMPALYKRHEEIIGDRPVFPGITIHFNSTMPGQPVAVAAIPTNDKLMVDGQAVEPAAYKIDGANYFKLRDVAALLNGTRSQFNVDWDGAAQSAFINANQELKTRNSPAKSYYCTIKR